MTSWNVRGCATPLMVPNPVGLTRLPLASYGRFVIVRSVRLAKLAVALTPVNCVWFSALNTSSRNSNFAALTTWNRFEIDRSTLLIGGRRTKNRADSAPSLPGCGGAKHDVSNCWYGSLLQPLPGSHVSAMRAAGLPSLPVRLALPMPGIEKPMVYGPAARPAIHARELPVVGQHAQRAARDLRHLVDGVDHEVVRPVVVRVRVVEPPRLLLARDSARPRVKSSLLMPSALLQT